jgi:hypothetical protein
MGCLPADGQIRMIRHEYSKREECAQKLSELFYFFGVVMIIPNEIIFGLS